MARSRNIKPGFFTNDVLGELPPLARLLWIGLWTICDREGRVEDRPKKIKAEVLPYDDCDADALLGQLQGAGFILRYAVNGQRLIQVKNWHKHQNPHVKEAASSLPAPDEHQTNTVQASDKSDNCMERAGLIPDSGFLIPDSSSPTVHIAAGAAPTVEGQTKKRKTALPADFGISERVRKWATDKGYGQIEAHLEAFKAKCAANDYRKVSWDDFFMEAIREDWAKLRGRGPNGTAPPPDQIVSKAADYTTQMLEDQKHRADDSNPEAIAAARAKLAELSGKMRMQ